MTSDFLTQILERKRQELGQAKKEIPERTLRDHAESLEDRRPFLEKLAAPGLYGVNIIAEIKRASPSRGYIRADLEPDTYAKIYERGGAAALSVLTERNYFQGSTEDLKKARSATSLSVLRKDFLISTYQIYESVVIGADAVLLIVRVLSLQLLKDCVSLCRELHLGALVEVHSERELETATKAEARLIGINNRDLNTFQTDINNCIWMSRYLESNQIAIAESGIGAREDVKKLQQAGLWNFLVGESLVKASDPEGFLRHLLGREGAGS